MDYAHYCSNALLTEKRMEFGSGGVAMVRLKMTYLLYVVYFFKYKIKQIIKSKQFNCIPGSRRFKLQRQYTPL